MRQLSLASIAFVLALLLISTTPMGTGSGVHEFDLVHPLFSHMHLVDGRIVSHEQLQQAAYTAKRGPVSGGVSFNVDRGGFPGGLEVGTSPTLTPQDMTTLGLATVAWLDAETQRLQERDEAPPDPPPLP